MPSHLFKQVPGFLCEVGREIQFAFKNFVDGFLPVFPSEWWLEREKTVSAPIHELTNNLWFNKYD